MSAMLIVSSIVRVLILPPLSLFLLVAAGWILRRWWLRLGQTVIVLALALLFFLCTEFGASLLVRPLENMTAPLTSSPVASSPLASNPLTTNKDRYAQAIVVLAAGRLEHAPEYGNQDIPDYIALARLRYAAKLQHETGLPILVTGGNALSRDGVWKSKADAMASALREDFVTPVKWVEGRSENTAENAFFSAKILRQNGVSRILLVTDAMHMPRAKMVFEKSGLEVLAAPTMFFGATPTSVYDFLPSAEGLRRSHYAIYEWTGLWWYWYRYRD